MTQAPWLPTEALSPGFQRQLSWNKIMEVPRSPRFQVRTSLFTRISAFHSLDSYSPLTFFIQKIIYQFFTFLNSFTGIGNILIYLLPSKFWAFSNYPQSVSWINGTSSSSSAPCYLNEESTRAALPSRPSQLHLLLYLSYIAFSVNDT